jgi:lysophospholipase L1-like esterase
MKPIVVALAILAGLRRDAAAGERPESAAGHPPNSGGRRIRVAPMPRTDTNSVIAHLQMVAKARKGGVDLYFVGDSITRRWGASDPQYREFLMNWRTNFFGWNAGNFGWGGDTVQNILWRLQNGELDGVNPKVVVVLAGTNNLGDPAALEHSDRLVDEVAEGLQAILATIRERAPAARVVLTAIPSRADGGLGAKRNPLIRRINERASTLADGKSVLWLDLNKLLADAAGNPLEGTTVDGLHPSLKGYEVWAKALKPILTEWMGPPAATDHSPPPTGDPKVVGRAGE